jgi:hypothetical protein
MRYVMIDRNGLVVNAIEASEDDPPSFENYTLRPSETAEVGDRFDGKEFVAATPRRRGPRWR